MVTSNQTRIGFTQKKPNTRRQLNVKNSKDVVPEAKTAQSPVPVEQVLETAVKTPKTMEEKLAEYKKQKEAEKAQKTQPPSRTQLNRTRSSTRDSTKNATITSYLATKSSGSSTKAVTEQELPAESQQSDNETAKLDSKDVTRQTRVEITQSILEVTVEVQSQETKQTETDNSSHSKDSVKPPVDDEDQNKTSNSNHDSDNDNDIHPLARLVAKASPRTSIGKIQVEETIESNQSSSSSNHSIIKTPTKHSTRFIPSEFNTQKPSLPLPSHMDILFANFKAFENVYGFTKRQGQLCFYHKIKKHVELQSSRNFEIRHLAQLKTLLPEVYKFEAALCLFEGAKTKSILIEMLELKDETENKFAPQEEKRRNLFTKRMNENIKQHHEKFLNSTNPPRTNTYPHNWHPEFDLESVPPVEEAEIPLLPPPVVNILDLKLKDLGNRRDLVPRNSREELPEVSLSTEKKKTVITSEEFAKVAPDSSGVKALSALEQLKERIRLRQLERKESGQKVLTPEAKRLALISSRLPAVFDLIRFKRIDVTPLKALVEQVVKSSRMPISEVDGRDSLEMLAKAIPEWCSVFSLDDGSRYFKVLRDDDKGAKIAHDEKALRARLVSKTINNP